ncbi:MAG: ATP synthase F1 subunit gamma [Capsulimonadaceae bacterium]|nr:ATP synthase F1 subunit gamma [Capsulimonadaceae bacterium]
MATMRQIRSRIRVAKNIQQITKAMKLVAAARLRRAQDAVAAARPYSSSIRDVVKSVAMAAGTVRHPLLRHTKSADGKVGVLLVAGDRGLCGSYNTNATRSAMDLVRGIDPANVRMVCVGARGATFFRRRGYDVVAEYGVQAAGTTFARAQEVASVARNLFETGQVDTLHLVFTRFISAMTQRSEVITLFPLEAPEAEDAGVQANVEFEPSADEILETLLPRYVDALVYQALVESTASFFGAQMTSMSSATDNAGKMISTLTLSLNRARQATITKEISEIVGGAEALK